MVPVHSALNPRTLNPGTTVLLFHHTIPLNCRPTGVNIMKAKTDGGPGLNLDRLPHCLLPGHQELQVLEDSAWVTRKYQIDCSVEWDIVWRIAVIGAVTHNYLDYWNVEIPRRSWVKTILLTHQITQLKYFSLSLCTRRYLHLKGQPIIVIY